MVQGIIAGGHKALTRSQEGAEDRVESAVEDLDAHGVRNGDFVIGIAASGTTPYVRRALAHAREHRRAHGARRLLAAARRRARNSSTFSFCRSPVPKSSRARRA